MYQENRPELFTSRDVKLTPAAQFIRDIPAFVKCRQANDIEGETGIQKGSLSVQVSVLFSSTVCVWEHNSGSIFVARTNQLSQLEWPHS